ncbi:hypothetical protein SAMN04487962_12533 [Marinobacter segnicrescens]|uniref:Uncharacterized protein n=1 Tax=Marinobacter segnicrescens TaxID=430453 RepID=A0A1I0H8A3_9GAMM|nr:hypothetical protein SAMN04487962_12533 [Marinobacter segnicrescens]
MLKLINASILVCLTILLQSCATTEYVTKTEIQVLTPPTSLLEPTPEPVIPNPLTYRGLGKVLIEYKNALKQSNADKSAVIRWIEDNQ